MDKEQTKKINIKVIIAACLILVVIVFVVVYFILSTPKLDSQDNNSNEDKSISEQAADNTLEDLPSDTANEEAQDENTQTLSPAEIFYQNAIAKSAEGEYDAAIIEIDQALALNQKYDLYWSKKASFYGLKGDTSMEKAIIEQGLEIIPNSDLLLSQLDIINREWSNTDTTTRE